MMKLKQPFARILILLLILFNIGCDQLTKIVVREHVDYDEQIPVIKNHFTILKVENTGAFLSSGESLPLPVKFVFLSLLPLFILGYALYYLMVKRNLNRLLMIGISCIIGGGLGNLYDRMVFGSVTDFLHLDFVIFQTGVFNLADLSISLGALLILISLYYKKAAPIPAEQ
ncbi:MAG TPA: signal peptidase II [Pedobacter sp.]|uniref:signal peptidase II n=1 Tax=Pedobacter sp. TaxID=1411316 RepID=UPI002BA69AF3|nr:signal peptidase II [Pedobacter sp.]HMI01967.1 signal peptidase II [Pedobacter sp.]